MATKVQTSKRQTHLQRLAALIEPVSDAADMLGVSRQRFHELIQHGDLEAVKIGKGWFVSSLSLQERIEKFADRRQPNSPI